MDTFTTDIIMVTIAMGKWLEWFTEFTMGKPNWSFSLRFWWLWRLLSLDPDWKCSILCGLSCRCMSDLSTAIYTCSGRLLHYSSSKYRRADRGWWVYSPICPRGSLFRSSFPRKYIQSHYYQLWVRTCLDLGTGLEGTGRLSRMWFQWIRLRGHNRKRNHLQRRDLQDHILHHSCMAQRCN